jgi:tetratricopeptide (TPR) repeat protein
MNNLATVYRAQSRLAEAEKVLLDLVEIRKRVSGPDHPDTLAAMGNLSNVYADMDRPADALPLVQAVRTGMLRVLGPDHPDALFAGNRLASALAALGRYAEAEPLLREVIAGESKRGGPQSPAVLRSQSDLGELLMRAGRLDEAEQLLAGALAAQRKGGVAAQDVPETVGRTAMLAAQRGDKELALRLLREALDGATSLEKVSLLGDKLLAPLRGDARFEALASEVKKSLPAH